MRSWDELLGTIAWINKETTAVPCFHPYHDNDYLYLAYMLRLYRPVLTPDQKQFIKLEMYDYAFRFQRFGKTDSISHDEVLGLAVVFWYLEDQPSAKLFIGMLRDSGGKIHESGHPWPDVFRIPGVEMFLGVSAGEKPSTLPQLLFLGSCIVSSFAKRDHASPFLRKWVVVPLCKDAPIAAIGICIFTFVMWLRKFTLRGAFELYFSKVKQIHEAAEGKGWLDA
jgi:hypothetical protein